MVIVEERLQLIVEDYCHLEIQQSTKIREELFLINGGADATIINSTITQNQGTVGGLMINGGGIANIYNSTIAGDAGSELTAVGTSLNIYNTAFVCTGNATCYLTTGASVNNVNSILGSGTLAEYGLMDLADNGGSTKTMALSGDSSLIDAGDDTVCANTFVNNMDQRGVIRPQGGHCDIGALKSVVHYVKWNADGANNGTSWTDAYTDLQSALSAASSGDEIGSRRERIYRGMTALPHSFLKTAWQSMVVLQGRRHLSLSVIGKRTSRS